MTPERFSEITSQYSRLSVAVIGDFCLDRYLEIDASKNEISIETGLPVYNVMNVRSQPGAAGTVLNNLAALGVGTIFPVGVAGDDGEGYELRRALAMRPGVRLDYFLQSAERATFTYCKPLIIERGQTPRELNRLDQKNWTPTPPNLVGQLREAVLGVASHAQAFALLSQVDLPETGVVTSSVLETCRKLAEEKPSRVIIADSRHSLRGFPPVIFKMNAAELAALTGVRADSAIQTIGEAALRLAQQNGREVFVTLAERGILGATAEGKIEHIAALPVRGEIDIVGAGDAVLANLIVALAAGANLREALELANAAASIVIHQLGTTGTATVSQLSETLFGTG